MSAGPPSQRSLVLALVLLQPMRCRYFSSRESCKTSLKTSLQRRCRYLVYRWIGVERVAVYVAATKRCHVVSLTSASETRTRLDLTSHVRVNQSTSLHFDLALSIHNTTKQNPDISDASINLPTRHPFIPFAGFRESLHQAAPIFRAGPDQHLDLSFGSP